VRRGEERDGAFDPGGGADVSGERAEVSFPILSPRVVVVIRADVFVVL